MLINYVEAGDKKIAHEKQWNVQGASRKPTLPHEFDTEVHGLKIKMVVVHDTYKWNYCSPRNNRHHKRRENRSFS